MFRQLPVLVLLALSAAACAGDHKPGHFEPINQVSVSGKGFVTVVPDEATLNLNIQIRKPDLQDAQREVADIANRFLELTDQLGIDRRHVQTVGSTARPEYRWNKQRNEQELTGYSAGRLLRVELKDLDKLGSLIEGAVTAGVNQVNPPQLRYSKERDAYREALVLAAEDARANAQVLAETLDAELGDVLSVSAGGPPAPPRPMYRMEAMAADAGAAPEASYNAGEIRFDASVSASFELDD